MAKQTKEDVSDHAEAAIAETPKKPTRNQIRISVLDKMDKILDLTEMGASIRQISVRLREQGYTGTSRSNVAKLLKKALDSQAKDVNLKAKHHVQIALNKMQRIELAHYTKLLNATDPDAIEKLSRALERVWKRQDALLGTHKPVKVRVDAREALAKLLGKTPEELPSGDSDS